MVFFPDYDYQSVYRYDMALLMKISMFFYQQFINLNYNGDAELSKDNQSLKRSTAKCLTLQT